LPDSLGVETYLKLKLQVPEIPVVVLSGSEDEEMSLKAVHAGAQDYLIKGQIDSNLLVRSLRYAIERKSAEDIIKNLAYHDSLTGLPSRTLFNDRFTMAIADSKRNDRKTAFIMLDLDQFKEINDNFGHDIGDEVLKEVSTKLTGILRQTDTVCRMGGDEFALLIPEIKAKEMIDEVAQRILEVIGKPFTVHSVEETISGSLGIAIYPDDGETLETLIKHADMAMYEVKRMGRNNYLFYQPGIKSGDSEKY
jgi:diguanylate cyclase (GGDEF)-like protein